MYFELVRRYNRLMTYFWQTDSWPNFTYELSDSCEKDFYAFVERAGRVSGLVEGLDDTDQTTTLVQLMVAEAIKTSEIEGEYLSREDVISSVRNNLGLNDALENIGDKRAEGAAALTMAVRDGYECQLSETVLFDWHSKMLSWDKRVNSGAWRTHDERLRRTECQMK